MKIRMGQVIFGVGVFLITIWALLQIKKSNENNSERFSKFESDRKKPSHESVQESEEIHEQRTTTLGTYPALRGTCFLPETGGKQYVYNDRVKDSFQDLQRAILKVASNNMNRANENVGQNDTIANLLNLQKTMAVIESETQDKFHRAISRFELYPDEFDVVDELLYEISTLPISNIWPTTFEMQSKFEIFCRDGQRAIMKFVRTRRDEQSPSNQLYYAEIERATSEIAAFHIDRILGSRRAMPVIGRKINIVTDLIRACDDQNIRKSLHISKQNNLCFYDAAPLYGTSYSPICGDGFTLECSLCAILPSSKEVNRTAHPHPWKRMYNLDAKAPWEIDPEFGEKVKFQAPYDSGTLLLEFVDLSIFDFLIGNQNRYDYEQFDVFGKNSFIIRDGNGKAFGRAYHDDLGILAPLIQSCIIRTTTLKTLLSIHNGHTPLSELARISLSKDPIAPILWQPHLKALDRRLSIVLQAVRDCINRHSIDKVLVSGRMIMTNEQ